MVSTNALACLQSSSVSVVFLLKTVVCEAEARQQQALMEASALAKQTDAVAVAVAAPGSNTGPAERREALSAFVQLLLGRLMTLIRPPTDWDCSEPPQPTASFHSSSPHWCLPCTDVSGWHAEILASLTNRRSHGLLRYPWHEGVSTGLRSPTMFALLLVALGYFVPCFCKIYEDVNQLPGLSYDFVVVGGGGAGNVVANRLTQNPDFSVLVLEAGVSRVYVYRSSVHYLTCFSNENVTDSIVPFLVNGLLVPGIYEWNYTSIPQPGLNGRSIGIPRAHMLGGCTSHNGMIYTRGSADDYNRFAEVTGDPGWSWDRLLPYFFKNEKWTPPVDHHDTRGQFDPRVHSTTGITAVSLSGYPWTTFSNHVLAATAQQPEDWHFNLDTNSGKPLGTSWVQTTIQGGVRSSSATSYLGPEFIRRPNLHVLLHAQVSKLVNPGHVNGKIHFEDSESLIQLRI
ncbi:hypothetical protein C8R46DRAFT_1346666 [Mycena filopes]|nr:hypothetical protein C8R46DRAFT_1346666 [Mycena filopes]